MDTPFSSMARSIDSAAEAEAAWYALQQQEAGGHVIAEQRFRDAQRVEYRFVDARVTRSRRG